MLHSSSWENVQNMYSQGSENIMKSRISGHREGKYNTVLLTVLQFFLFMLSANIATACRSLKLMAGTFRTSERKTFFTQRVPSL